MTFLRVLFTSQLSCSHPSASLEKKRNTFFNYHICILHSETKLMWKPYIATLSRKFNFLHGKNRISEIMDKKSNIFRMGSLYFPSQMFFFFNLPARWKFMRNTFFEEQLVGCSSYIYTRLSNAINLRLSFFFQLHFHVFHENVFFFIYHDVFYFAIKRHVSLSKRCPNNVDPILWSFFILMESHLRSNTHPRNWKRPTKYVMWQFMWYNQWNSCKQFHRKYLSPLRRCVAYTITQEEMEIFFIISYADLRYMS